MSIEQPQQDPAPEVQVSRDSRWLSFDVTIFTILVISPMNKVQGGIEESLCLTVKIRVQPITFFWFDIKLAYHIWHMGVSP